MKHPIQSLLALILLMFSTLLFADSVRIDSPYVRAVPPGQTISAAFMLLKNNSDQDIDLIKASSNIAKNVELHEHIHADGMMKMRQIPKISIAANSETALKPGGYHIMLIGLKKEIKAGDFIDLRLKFSNGDEQTVQVEVKKIAMGMMKKKAHQATDMNLKMTTIKHVNPMPMLMKVITKYADKLELTEQQNAELKQWRDERHPVSKKLIGTIIDLEADIHKAVMNNESLERIDQLADDIMQNRIKMIRSKALCRDNMKRILNEEQYEKVLALYTTHFM